MCLYTPVRGVVWITLGFVPYVIPLGSVIPDRTGQNSSDGAFLSCFGGCVLCIYLVSVCLGYKSSVWSLVLTAIRSSCRVGNQD